MGNLLRPLVRFVIGILAIPAFRFFLRRVIRLEQLDAELEKDLEQWFKCSLMLLVSTSFMEPYLFGWLVGDSTNIFKGETIDPLLGGMRILLAIGVIELMPDQHLFSIVHPGPPRLRYDRSRGFWEQVRENFKPVVRGLVCQHINRSSPVFAILAAIVPNTTASVVCYLIAIVQYLIIGLVTSADRALDVLSEFDRQVAIRRRKLIYEFNLEEAVQDRAERESAETAPSGRSAEAPATDQSAATSSPPPRSQAGFVAKAGRGEYESD